MPTCLECVSFFFLKVVFFFLQVRFHSFFLFSCELLETLSLCVLFKQVFSLRYFLSSSVIIVILFAILQIPVWCSTSITHKHSQKVIILCSFFFSLRFTHFSLNYIFFTAYPIDHVVKSCECLTDRSYRCKSSSWLEPRTHSSCLTHPKQTRPDRSYSVSPPRRTLYKWRRPMQTISYVQCSYFSVVCVRFLCRHDVVVYYFIIPGIHLPRIYQFVKPGIHVFTITFRRRACCGVSSRGRPTCEWIHEIRGSTNAYHDAYVLQLNIEKRERT